MPTMIATHHVRDYDAWRPHFDQHEGKRREHGITNPRIYRNTADPNDLVLLADVADEARVKDFGASDDLRNVMESPADRMQSLDALYRHVPGGRTAIPEIQQP